MANRIITATVSGESIKLSNKVAGASGSFNAVSLAFTFDGAWDGTTKKVYFFDAYGNNAVYILLTDALLVDGAYIVPIPAEPLAYAGEMTITIKGVDLSTDGLTVERIVMSASTTMKVLQSVTPSSDVAPVEPTPTQAEQLNSSIETVTGMTVTAESLAEGSTPSVTKTKNADGTYNFNFGVPKGATGAQGLPGNLGYVFTATLLTSGWAGTEAPYSQTISVEGVELTGYAYVVSSGANCWLDYSDAAIRMEQPIVVGQAKFYCTTVPEIDVDVNILKVRID